MVRHVSVLIRGNTIFRHENFYSLDAVDTANGIFNAGKSGLYIDLHWRILYFSKDLVKASAVKSIM